MAADTLTTTGSEKQSARYIEGGEKILKVGDAYLGFVGWTVNQIVIESAFQHGLELPEIRTELELFEFLRRLHQKLKDEYFLSPDSDDAYESTPMTVLLMNRHGIFGWFWNRTVERYRRFAAVGSGSSYALGAMYAAYDELDRPVEDIARLGVEAGAEFDACSGAPITLRKLKLAG